MKLRHLLLLLVAEAAVAAPNVLFIAVDDLRPELGCYGASHMVTPHIDTLAGEGRVFRHHYVAVPTCGASRYALMTGLRPTASTDDNGAFVSHMPSTLPAEPESWVDLLRRNGWRTVSLGKITHEPDGYRWSYPSTYDIDRQYATTPDMRFSWNEILFDHDKWGAQRYPLFAYADGTGRVRNVSPAWESGVDAMGQSLGDEAYPDGLIAQAAIEKLREFSDDGTRFCMAVGFYKPHLPFNAPKAYFDIYDPATLPAASPAGAPIGANPATVTDSGEINAYTDRTDRDQLRHAYFACVSYVDAQIGKVLAELDALGLSDNTVVVLWGDHGWCLDDYGVIGKHKVLERAVESPLIIRPPTGVFPSALAGIPADGVVETIDIYPTIAELCGLTPPSSAAGSSLVPMLQNPTAPGKSHAYSRFGSLTTVRTNEWRLINTSGDFDLYDLSTFRYELEDVSGSYPGVVSALSAALDVQGTRPADRSDGSITYVDAIEGVGGNTFATGGMLEDTSWLVNPGSSAADEERWGKRTVYGNSGTILQSLHSVPPDDMPELTTQVAGLADGDYDVWVFFWDGPLANTWTLSAGLTSGALTTYSYDGPGHTMDVVPASTLSFSNSPIVTEDVRALYGVRIGRSVVSDGTTINVFVDNLVGGGAETRSWYDGVGYELKSSGHAGTAVIVR